MERKTKMDNEKVRPGINAKKVIVVLIPIVLAVIATVSVATMMGGSLNTPTPEPQLTVPFEPTSPEIPVGGEPETEAIKVSDSLSIKVGTDGRATVMGLGNCKDRVVMIPSVTSDGAPVTAIADSAFAYAAGIDEVVMPSSIVSIGAYAFRGSSITSVTVGSSVMSIGKGAFADCRGLRAINVDGANPMYTSKDGVLFNSNMSTLLCYPSGRQSSSYTIPESVTEIGDLAFSSCAELKKIKYDGNKKEWERVKIGSGNALLDSISVEVDSSDK